MPSSARGKGKATRRSQTSARPGRHPTRFGELDTTPTSRHPEQSFRSKNGPSQESPNPSLARYENDVSPGAKSFWSRGTSAGAPSPPGRQGDDPSNAFDDGPELSQFSSFNHSSHLPATQPLPCTQSANPIGNESPYSKINFSEPPTSVGDPYEANIDGLGLSEDLWDLVNKLAKASSPSVQSVAPDSRNDSIVPEPVVANSPHLHGDEMSSYPTGSQVKGQSRLINQPFPSPEDDPSSNAGALGPSPGSEVPKRHSESELALVPTATPSTNMGEQHSGPSGKSKNKKPKQRAKTPLLYDTDTQQVIPKQSRTGQAGVSLLSNMHDGFEESGKASTVPKSWTKRRSAGTKKPPPKLKKPSPKAKAPNKSRAPPQPKQTQKKQCFKEGKNVQHDSPDEPADDNFLPDCPSPSPGNPDPGVKSTSKRTSKRTSKPVTKPGQAQERPVRHAARQAAKQAEAQIAKQVDAALNEVEEEVDESPDEKFDEYENTEPPREQSSEREVDRVRKQGTQKPKPRSAAQAHTYPTKPCSAVEQPSSPEKPSTAECSPVKFHLAPFPLGSEDDAEQWPSEAAPMDKFASMTLIEDEVTGRTNEHPTLAPAKSARSAPAQQTRNADSKPVINISSDEPSSSSVEPPDLQSGPSLAHRHSNPFHTFEYQQGGGNNGQLHGPHYDEELRPFSARTSIHASGVFDDSAIDVEPHGPRPSALKVQGRVHGVKRPRSSISVSAKGSPLPFPNGHPFAGRSLPVEEDNQAESPDQPPTKRAKMFEKLHCDKVGTQATSEPEVAKRLNFRPEALSEYPSHQNTADNAQTSLMSLSQLHQVYAALQGLEHPIGSPTEAANNAPARLITTLSDEKRAIQVGEQLAQAVDMAVECLLAQQGTVHQVVQDYRRCMESPIEAIEQQVTGKHGQFIKLLQRSATTFRSTLEKAEPLVKDHNLYGRTSVAELKSLFSRRHYFYMSAVSKFQDAFQGLVHVAK